MNIGIIVGVVAVVLGLLVFVFIKNQRDKQELEKKLKNDYTKSKDAEGDADVEDTKQ